jgi:hypothetical protein
MDQKKTELFELAHRDPELKRRLLRNPAAVAEEAGVKLEEEEIIQLKKVAALTDLGDDIVYGRLFPRPPIGYPERVWEIEELLDIFSSLVIGAGPVSSPVVGGEQGESVAMLAYNPIWIKYPASLRNMLKERLVNVLQIAEKSQAIR